MRTLYSVKQARHRKTSTVRLHLHEVPGAVKSTETENRRGCQWTGVGDGELLSDGDRVSVWEDEKVLEMNGSDGCTPLPMYLH